MTDIEREWQEFIKWCKENDLDPKQHKNLRRYLDNVNSK